MLNRLYHIPLLGYVIRLATGILALPILIRNVEGLSLHLHTKVNQIEARLDVITAQLMTLGSLITELSGVSTWASDKIVKIESQVSELKKHKADLWIVDRLKEDKADHAALEEVAKVLMADIREIQGLR